eukprot:2986103-Rhodomonas_salina.3
MSYRARIAFSSLMLSEITRRKSCRATSPPAPEHHRKTSTTNCPCMRAWNHPLHKTKPTHRPACLRQSSFRPGTPAPSATTHQYTRSAGNRCAALAVRKRTAFACARGRSAPACTACIGVVAVPRRSAFGIGGWDSWVMFRILGVTADLDVELPLVLGGVQVAENPLLVRLELRRARRNLPQQHLGLRAHRRQFALPRRLLRHQHVHPPLDKLGPHRSARQDRESNNSQPKACGASPGIPPSAPRRRASAQPPLSTPARAAPRSSRVTAPPPPNAPARVNRGVSRNARVYTRQAPRRMARREQNTART